jgi:hypothetical protein
VGEDGEGSLFSDGHPANKRKAARAGKVLIAKNSPRRRREKQLFSACERG